jgi:hypothetical protein
MEIMGRVAMVSSKVQMQARHGLFTMLLSTAPVHATTAGIPWFSYWELIAMEVQISAVQWLGLMLIASQAENEPKNIIFGIPTYLVLMYLILSEAVASNR